jgi:hypothetical protein
MEALIVAKTHMRNASCVGAFELSTGKNIRLLDSYGDNQPSNVDFEVGQIWDLDYSVRTTLTAPHNEDVLVSGKRLIRTQNNLNTFLINNAPIWRGNPTNIFEGKVHFGIGKSGYITNRGGVPSRSVGFWLPDNDLEFTILDDQKHYFYFGENNDICAFPYVGFAHNVETIRQGTLIRVSLARWWKPSAKVEELRCYCQMSGWYID